MSQTPHAPRPWLISITLMTRERRTTSNHVPQPEKGPSPPRSWVMRAAEVGNGLADEVEEEEGIGEEEEVDSALEVVDSADEVVGFAEEAADEELAADGEEDELDSTTEVAEALGREVEMLDVALDTSD